MKVILQIIKWIFIVLILLFSVTTFMGKAWFQTALLWILAVSLAYWPGKIKEKWSKKTSVLSRTGFIFLLLISLVITFATDKKEDIYISEPLRQELMAIYDSKMAAWPADTRDIYINTGYGRVHVLACGREENPPLLMMHAASMGAHSWAENLGPVIGHFRIYAIDNIGEGNKSELKDAMVFPKNGKELAELYAEIADSLGVKKAVVFGASNGGFIALNYAYYYPARVDKLALFGPMGLTQLTGRSIMMLSVATMYPFDFIRDYVQEWALGDNGSVNKRYGKWFNCILRGTIPSVAEPVPMTKAQKAEMKMPVLLFLGTKDPIVGDAEEARSAAMDFPDIQIEVLESGHLISVEKADQVNRTIRRFLGV